MIQFIKEVFSHYFESDTFQRGASLAYYAVFSILPIIMILTSILGILFGEQAVSGEIYQELKGVLGNDASLQIQTFIKNQHTNHHSLITSIIGFITLIISASGMFIQIHNSFNSIWNIKSKPKNSFLNYFTTHLVSFCILICLFLLMLISTTVNTFLIKHTDSINESYKLLSLFEHLVSLIIFTFIFVIMFKFLGDAKINWKANVLGGLFTSILFLCGKTGIAMYISHNHISTTFGSASTLAILMIWVYYTSQIIFLGASFVKITSDRLGYEITPK